MTKTFLDLISQGFDEEDAKNIMAEAVSRYGTNRSKLANYIKETLNVKKVRGIELSLLQRAGAHQGSGRDIEEAFAAGKRAVEEAVSGTTGKMVAFKSSRDGEYEQGKDETVIKNLHSVIELIMLRT